MTDQLHIALAQLNPKVGDIDGNMAKIRAACKAVSSKTDLIVFTELIVTGYQTEDLVLRPAFMRQVRHSIETLAQETKDNPAILLSTPWEKDRHRYNSALLLVDGKISAIRHKHHLPNYGVFDDKRIFDAGPMPEPVLFHGISLGILTCEDIWFDDVAAHLKQAGAEIIIAQNGSPFTMNKHHRRLVNAAQRAEETRCPIIYTNQVGGQDALVYDGGSFLMMPSGNVAVQMPHFEEEIAQITLENNERNQWIPVDTKTQPALPLKDEAVYKAITLGLKDYVEKNGFPGVLLGLSGGIDSALCAALAVDALGADKVTAVMMPSEYTSQESLDDATALADNLGIELLNIPITATIKALHETLDNPSGIAAENLQSRSRGLILMAMSNENGKMVLACGNKSEMAVGYATLYGDMCGGYAPIKDVYKTHVYALSRWRNRETEIIPERIITKAPTAELKPNQTDQDSLPPYDILDDILYCQIENHMDVEETAAKGHDRDTVVRIRAMLDRSEYKRRQSAPGPRVSRCAFGPDRRYPITNGFTGK